MNTNELYVITIKFGEAQRQLLLGRYLKDTNNFNVSFGTSTLPNSNFDYAEYIDFHRKALLFETEQEALDFWNKANSQTGGKYTLIEIKKISEISKMKSFYNRVIDYTTTHAEDFVPVPTIYGKAYAWRGVVNKTNYDPTSTSGKSTSSANVMHIDIPEWILDFIQFHPVLKTLYDRVLSIWPELNKRIIDDIQRTIQDERIEITPEIDSKIELLMQYSMFKYLLNYKLSANFKDNLGKYDFRLNGYEVSLVPGDEVVSYQLACWASIHKTTGVLEANNTLWLDTLSAHRASELKVSKLEDLSYEILISRRNIMPKFIFPLKDNTITEIQNFIKSNIDLFVLK